MSVSLKVSDLTDHLGFWLRMVSNHVSQAFAAKLVSLEVTVAEWSLMRTLFGKEPTSPSQLADEMGMTRGAITKLANRLIAKSLLIRATGEGDGRTQTLVLTQRGNDLVPQLAALADSNDAQFFDCLTADERQVLEQLLKRLVNHGRMASVPVT